MPSDRDLLRALAWQYREAAMTMENAEKAVLYRAVNDLHMVRPVVLIDELPWHELNIDHQLDLHCEDAYLRTVEQYFRRVLLQHRLFPADMLLTPYFRLQKCIGDTGIGLAVQEATLAADPGNHIVSHAYEEQLQTEADLAMLHAPVISYDAVETMRRFEWLGDLFGDILPIRLCGISGFHVATWDVIPRFRGVTTALMDLVERPDFTHRLVETLTAFELTRIAQYEALGLLDTDDPRLHCTAALTDDLPQDSYDGVRSLTRKDIWGRGMAQIFGSVSADMHEEFDIGYMQRTIGQCGLSYYGCCEPLDKKMHIVEKLPNLRKVSITPWADVNIAAEAIGSRYVLANKPNPASVAAAALDESALRAELGNTLRACRRNGCHVELTLKDISTCHRRPENIVRWEAIAMEMAMDC